MKKTKRAPVPRQVLRQDGVRSAKPNHVRPVGRKMYVATAFLRDKDIRAFSIPRKRFKGCLTPVLVIPLDPENVERIRRVISAEIDKSPLHGSKYLTDITMFMLGLTPAKRKGRKAQ